MKDDREIQIICKIQDILNKVGYNSKINLPTIIVIGSQSSGKSSVLEHIAGVDFLPRGQGIVTRRPVIIQKIIDQNSNGDFALTEDEGKMSFQQLSKYLYKKMEEARQSQEGITSRPVVVKLIFKKGVNLSLIDMPGLTKIALQGQPENFPQMIEEINKTYIQNPNSILLAVSPANVDVANSDALRLAREFDPYGKRTIGVFTKMDLVEDPHTILKAFEGKAHSLQLGYYGVDDEIYWTIKNSQGLKQNAHFSNETFELFAKKQVFVLKEPCLDCLARVSEEVRNIAKDILFSMKELQMFTLVGQAILSGLEEDMDQHYNKTKSAIDLYIQIQSGSINSNHKHFVPLRREVLSGKLNYFEQKKGISDYFKKDSTQSFSQKQEVINMKNILNAYSLVIKDDFYDYVPKTILHLFVDQLLGSVEGTITERVTHKENPKQLCQIDKSKITDLQNTEQEVESLRKTLAVLEDVN